MSTKNERRARAMTANANTIERLMRDKNTYAAMLGDLCHWLEHMNIPESNPAMIDCKKARKLLNSL